MGRKKKSTAGLSLQEKLNREKDNYRNKARYKGKCFCPMDKRFSCIMNCSECKYERKDYSLDELYEERITIRHSRVVMGEIADDNPNNDPGRRTLVKLAVEEVMNCMREKFGSQMCDVFIKMSEGEKQNRIAEELNISTSTLNSQIQRVKEFMKEKFGDDFIPD